MKRLATWIARRLDGGLTPAGAAFGLALMFSGVGASVALSSGSLLLGVVLGLFFLTGLVLLFMVARYTDPNLRMTKEEKRLQWQQLPASVKRVGAVFVVGLLVNTLFTGPIAHGASWGLITVSEVLLVIAIRRESWRMPDGKGGLMTEADSPDQYRLRRKQAIRGLYAGITVSAAIAMVPLLRH